MATRHHKKRFSKKSSFGKYRPNRFVASYGGNLQNSVKLNSRKLFNLQSPLTSLTAALPANNDQFNVTFPINVALGTFEDQAAEVTSAFQQFRIRKLEITVRPAANTEDQQAYYLNSFGVAPHIIAGLGDSIEEAITYDTMRSMPGFQVRNVNSQIGGRLDTAHPDWTSGENVINAFLKAPTINLPGRIQGSTTSTYAVCLRSPWVACTSNGRSLRHYGFNVGASITPEGTTAATEAVLAFSVKALVEARGPKLGPVEAPSTHSLKHKLREAIHSLTTSEMDALLADKHNSSPTELIKRVLATSQSP